MGEDEMTACMDPKSTDELSINKVLVAKDIEHKEAVAKVALDVAASVAARAPEGDSASAELVFLMKNAMKYSTNPLFPALAILADVPMATESELKDSLDFVTNIGDENEQEHKLCKSSLVCNMASRIRAYLRSQQVHQMLGKEMEKVPNTISEQ